MDNRLAAWLLGCFKKSSPAVPRAVILEMSSRGTDPGKSIPTKCYPSRYDFASKATYLGREKLHVESLFAAFSVAKFQTCRASLHRWFDLTA